MDKALAARGLLAPQKVTQPILSHPDCLVALEQLESRGFTLEAIHLKSNYHPACVLLKKDQVEVKILKYALNEPYLEIGVEDKDPLENFFCSDVQDDGDLISYRLIDSKNIDRAMTEVDFYVMRSKERKAFYLNQRN